MEDACDFKIMFRQRVHVHDRVTGNADLLTDGESEVLCQVPLHRAFLCVLRHAPFQQDRKRHLFRQRDDRDGGLPVPEMEPGVDLPDALRFSDAREGTDLLQILVGHEHGGSDLHIPQLTVVEENQRVLLQRRSRVGDPQVSQRGQQPDHDDRDEGDKLFPDVAAGVK